MKLLEGENITLRAPELTDLDILYNWENNPDAWIYGNTLSPFSKYILSKYLETAQLDIYEAKQLRLMVDLKTMPKKTIGIVDLFDFDPFHNRAGVGILIADNEHRQHGFAYDSLLTLKAYCFKVLMLNQLYCNIGIDNTESLKLFQKCGFEISGQKRNWLRRENGFVDEYFLQLINTDRS